MAQRTEDRAKGKGRKNMVFKKADKAKFQSLFVKILGVDIRKKLGLKKKGEEAPSSAEELQ